jgi:hypothetical protein
MAAKIVEPIQLVEWMGKFIKDKLHEHHQQNVGLEYNPPPSC